MRSSSVPTRRFAPGLVFAAAFASPWSVATEIELDRDKRHQRSAFVAVVGQWSLVQDEGPAFKADSDQWNGQTRKADLESVGRSLFASVGEPFLSNGLSPDAFPLAVWRDVADFSAGTIRVQFKLVGGPTDQTAGLVFGLQPSGEYFFFRYNTKDGNVALWRYAGGQRSVIARGTATTQLPLNTWHELSVTIAGAKVTGSMDRDALTLEHRLDKPVSGRVGVWTKRDAVTVFKSLRVGR